MVIGASSTPGGRQRRGVRGLSSCPHLLWQALGTVPSSCPGLRHPETSSVHSPWAGTFVLKNGEAYRSRLSDKDREPKNRIGVVEYRRECAAREGRRPALEAEPVRGRVPPVSRAGRRRQVRRPADQVTTATQT